MCTALRWTLVASLALLLLPATAPAQDFFISSGGEGGYYQQVGRRLEIMLIQQNREVEHAASEGSKANLARLADPGSPVNVTFAQADAVRRYLDDNPGLAKQLLLVDDIGTECVILVTRAKDGIATAADLKKASERTLSVGGPDSGAAVTYETMTRLEPAFANTRVVYVDILEALLKLRLGGEYSNLVAAMLVARPRTVSPAMEIVLDNPDDYRVAAIRPEDVPLRRGDAEVPKLPDGSPVYRFAEVTTGFGKGYALTYPTLCTRGLLLASRAKLSAELQHDLSKVMLEAGRLIAPGRAERAPAP